MQRKIRYNKAEVITMEKTMTLNLRVNPTVKQQAEDVLKQLGNPMTSSMQTCRWASKKYRTVTPWMPQAHSHSSGNSTDEAV